MERLFSPCTRYQDILESQVRPQIIRRRRRSRGFLDVYRSRSTEVLQELNLDVSTEELLSAERAFTYSDLYAMSGNQNTVLWLTPHAAVVRKSKRVVHYWSRLNRSYRISFSADGKDMVALALFPEHLLEICDVVFRLLARSIVHSLILQSWSPCVALIPAPTLASLMEHCPSLKLLSLKDLKMDENHCRVLGAYSRPDLEIILVRCKFTSAGAYFGRGLGRTRDHRAYLL
jgi:hypothetical protein